MKAQLKSRDSRLLLIVYILCVVAVGSKTAFAQNARWGIWVMRTDGSDLRMLAQVNGHKEHTCPRWSHDGKRVLFDARSDSSRQTSVFVINADGTGLKNLGPAAHPVWSPDDKQMAAEVFNGQRTISVQNLDGLGRTQLAIGSSPAWSPDATRIAYQYDDNVFVMDLVTSQAHSLFRSPKETVYYGLTWFPDSKRLAVVARPERRKSRELLFVSAEGEEKGIEVRWTGEMAGFLSFSPDGKRLALDSSYRVRLLEVQGDSKPELVPGQVGASRDPDWSPDGEWIVFTSSRDPQ